MSIQMSFIKDGNNIKLESITDDGNPLNIEKYKDTHLLTIKDGTYMEPPQVPVSLSNTQQLFVQPQKDADSTQQAQETVESNQSGQGDSTNSATIKDSLLLPDVKDGQGKEITMGGQRKNKTKRMRAGKKNKSKRVRFMSRRNRRR